MTSSSSDLTPTPAGVRGAADAADAARRIARSASRFISRGDQSGTHEREQALWKAAGAVPAGDRLVVAGAGMGATLRIAGETGSYTLTDRATYAQQRDRRRWRSSMRTTPRFSTPMPSSSIPPVLWLPTRRRS